MLMCTSWLSERRRLGLELSTKVTTPQAGFGYKFCPGRRVSIK